MTPTERTTRQRRATIGVILSMMAGLPAADMTVEYFTPRPADLTRPPADVPFDLRVENYWGGSCFHASTQVALRWADQGAIADDWRQKFGGGASIGDITRRLDHYQIPYHATDAGDVAVLDFAHNTRRVAAIAYYPGHAISFLGWCQKDGKELACLLDNNRIDRFIFVEKAEFIRLWRGRYYGWAVVPLVDPPPPAPYDPHDFLVRGER